jgi:hypothetical protein
VGFVVDKVELGEAFPCRFHSTGAPLLGKGQKIITIIIVTFIAGLHNKPQGCGASVAPAAGPVTTKKKYLVCYLVFCLYVIIFVCLCVISFCYAYDNLLFRCALVS